MPYLVYQNNRFNIAVIGSVFLHAVILTAILLRQNTSHIDKLSVNQPISINIKQVISVPMQDNNQTSLSNTDAGAQPLPAAVQLPEPVPELKPKAEVVPLHIPKTLMEHKHKVHKKIVHKVPVYKKVIDEIKALPDNEVPVPQSYNSNNIRKITNIVDDGALARKYAVAIGNCIQSKFHLIALGQGSYNFKITAHFTLDKQGELKKLLSINVDGGDAGQEAVANSQTADAIRACSPFLLPPDKYDLWREVNLQFYPFRS